MPGPGEPSAFLREATRGHDAIHAAALERRWEADTGRSDRDAFTEFQKSGSYTSWSQPVESDLAAAVVRAVTNIDVARQLAIMENRLPPRNWKRPVLSDAALKAATDLLRFGSQGSLALLAEEGETRSKLAAGGTVTLSTAQLQLIDSVRATVRNKDMDLGSHLADLERAVRIEVSKQAGEPFDYSATWAGMKFDRRFADVRTALDAWYTALDSPTQLQQPETLARLADDVRNRLGDLLGDAPRLVSAMRPGEAVDAPVTNSGLELHATLVAREIGEQLIARIGAPTVVATYRFANERPEPPGGVPSGQGTLLKQMLDRPDRSPEIWRDAAENGVKAAESTGVLDATTAKALRAFIVDIRNDLSAWSIAFDNVAAEGPGTIHRVAAETTLHLRLLDKLLAGTKVQAPAAMRLRTAIDTVYGKLRVDAFAAVQLLAD